MVEWMDPELWTNISNGSDAYSNCSNDYCIPDEDYVALMEKYVFPTAYEWVLIALHMVVFFLGLVGNALVCAAVYRNPGMRTVTNYFLVNLAVADFLVILLCLPPTVIWDVTETWFMGMALCKIVVYFQNKLNKLASAIAYYQSATTVSVAVSVLTLTFISVERWYAICFPLQFRSTISRAKRAIALIWIVSLLFDLPELVVLQTQRKDLRVESVLLTQCNPSWGRHSDMIFHYIKSLVLYTLPLTLMSIAYCQIARVLWHDGHFPSRPSPYQYQYQGDRRRGRRGRRGRGGGGGGAGAGAGLSGSVSTHGQVRSRKKAAKMLVAVVALFAVCYFPVHLLNVLRYTVDIPQTEGTVALSLVSHWLCYANSALNPLIYNFMSGKFRKEFRRTFGCCWVLSHGRGPRGPGRGRPSSGLDGYPPPAPLNRVGSRLRFQLTGGCGSGTGSGCGPRDELSQAELVPLTTLNPNFSPRSQHTELEQEQA